MTICTFYTGKQRKNLKMTHCENIMTSRLTALFCAVSISTRKPKRMEFYVLGPFTNWQWSYFPVHSKFIGECSHPKQKQTDTLLLKYIFSLPYKKGERSFAGCLHEATEQERLRLRMGIWISDPLWIRNLCLFCAGLSTE